MKIHCPHPECSSSPNPGPKKKLFVRNGFFFRKSDSRRITRYRCNCCGKHFSNSTFTPNYYQKKRRLTHALVLAMNSGMTQRRAAKNLGVARTTVIRRFRYLAAQGRINHAEWREKTYRNKRVDYIQFDDLESSEHTKCKPLSVALAVDPKTYCILDFQVSRMSAKGKLARFSREKYNRIKDDRPNGWTRMMNALGMYVEPDAVWLTDENPHYPKYIKKHFPKATHKTIKGKRGRVTGQGELKKVGFDPIFAINHCCAMLRANLSRLVRKTWSTTKDIQGLIDHLSIYVHYHNTVLRAGYPRISPVTESSFKE